MRPDSRVVLIESLIPETPEITFGKWLDLHMLMVPGGRERTAAEYAGLLREEGFELDSIVRTASPLSLIVALPV